MLEREANVTCTPLGPLIGFGSSCTLSTFASFPPPRVLSLPHYNALPATPGTGRRSACPAGNRAQEVRHKLVQENQAVKTDEPDHRQEELLRPYRMARAQIPSLPREHAEH